jgi:hypothetical protein
LAESLPNEVPHGDLDRPRPASVEVDRLADLANALGAQRVKTHEEPLEQCAVGQAVAPGRDAGHALVGMHEHHRCLLLRARNGIPRGVKRWVEWEQVPACLDARDQHQLPP